MTDQNRNPITDAHRARIEGAYRLADGVDATIWDEVLTRAADDGGPITVIEIARLHSASRHEFDRYLAAAVPAAKQAGGALFAVSDILEPGVGDLLPYMDYAGGVATLLTFPSRQAWLDALRSDGWQAGLYARRAAVSGAIVLVAGENTIPPMVRSRLGEPRMASDFDTPRIEGKAPGEIVDELLAIYPDGGADPSRAQLEVMMHYPGFREQPVHYVKV